MQLPDFQMTSPQAGERGCPAPVALQARPLASRWACELSPRKREERQGKQKQKERDAPNLLFPGLSKDPGSGTLVRA